MVTIATFLLFVKEKGESRRGRKKIGEKKNEKTKKPKPKSKSINRVFVYRERLKSDILLLSSLLSRTR